MKNTKQNSKKENSIIEDLKLIMVQKEVKSFMSYSIVISLILFGFLSTIGLL